MVVAPAPCHALHPRHNFNYSIDCSIGWSHYFNFSSSKDVKIISTGEAAREKAWHSHHHSAQSRTSVMNITSSLSHCQCSNIHAKPAELEETSSDIAVLEDQILKPARVLEDQTLKPPAARVDCSNCRDYVLFSCPDS